MILASFRQENKRNYFFLRLSETSYVSSDPVTGACCLMFARQITSPAMFISSANADVVKVSVMWNSQTTLAMDSANKIELNGYAHGSSIHSPNNTANVTSPMMHMNNISQP